jgi:hypothetical protein
VGVGSVLFWQRLDVSTRSDDLGPGLAARVADPLWLLARQWQLGELRGEDAGSPVLAQVTGSTAPLAKWRPGPLPAREKSGPESRPRVVTGERDLAPGPLEPLVEAEAVTAGPAGTRNAAEAGLHALRLLGAIGRLDLRKKLCDEFPLELPSKTHEPAACALRSLVGRVPDGAALRRRLAERGVSAVRLELLLDADAADSLIAWAAWYDARFYEPAGKGDSWLPERMEYAFAVATGGSSEVVLEAREYPGGELGWSAFDVRADVSLSARGDPKPFGERLIPTPVAFAGMPKDRFWEVEDGTVDIAAIDAGPTDVARMLLREFALVYGNDWFLIPMDLDVGGVARVTKLLVLDSFGQATTIESATKRDGPNSAWQWLTLTGDRAAETSAAPLLLLVPTLGAGSHGTAIEQVAFIRDEAANLAWGVERIVEAADGRAIDRFEDEMRKRSGSQDSPADPPRYTLSSLVPAYWYPFVPVRAAGGSSIRLRRGRLATSPAGAQPSPEGLILAPGRRLLIHEAEVDRAGLTVERTWQEARDELGRTLRWVGRRKRHGHGARPPGLKFDYLR